MASDQGFRAGLVISCRVGVACVSGQGFEPSLCEAYVDLRSVDTNASRGRLVARARVHRLHVPLQPTLKVHRTTTRRLSQHLATWQGLERKVSRQRWLVQGSSRCVDTTLESTASGGTRATSVSGAAMSKDANCRRVEQQSQSGAIRCNQVQSSAIKCNQVQSSVPAAGRAAICDRRAVSRPVHRRARAQD